MLIFTPQARKLYKALKTYQVEHSVNFCIDLEHGRIWAPVLFDNERPLPFQGSELRAVLEYLVSIGYVEQAADGSYTLTYLGRFPVQVRLDGLMHFLFDSVAVPIIMSLITTLIALRLR